MSGASSVVAEGLPFARIVGVGSAFPEKTYTQEGLFAALGLKNKVSKKVFTAAHIMKRHLMLGDPDPATGLIKHETTEEMQEKFRTGSALVGGEAIKKALENAGITTEDVSCIVAVTSSGFMCPGLSCLFIRELNLPHHVQRVDVVGMGCNAGLNGMLALNGWSRQNPGKYGVMICCEINTATYSPDDTARDGIVNSLFGDGASACVVRSDDGDKNKDGKGPRILTFSSHIVPEEWGAMRFDWHPGHHRFHFFLSKDIPYILGVHAGTPVQRLLEGGGIRKGDVEHWVIHTGGGSVIDAIKMKLNLSEHDVRHTRSVLRDYGNLSSGSFLVSYERLMEEDIVRPGDYGVMMTMGPGAQIETALLQW